MLLHDILSKIEYKLIGDLRGETEIRSICRDSRLATADSIFVCIKGAAADGHDFARAAYAKGARIFLAERKLELPSDALTILVPDTRIGLALLSAEFYGHPDKELKIVGITGTKGKTTSALTAYSVLNAAGIKSGYIGSNGVRFDQYSYKTANTTPESCDLFKYMRLMVDSGVKYLVMEVSSQAIFMNRIHGIEFDICAFTNLYIDHIGGAEHPTFEHYRDSKRRLFTDFGAKNVIFNADDEWADYMVKDSNAKLISFSCLKNDTDFHASSIESSVGEGSLCVSFDIKFLKKLHSTHVCMPGAFSVYNALLACAVCHELGLSVDRICSLLPSVSIDGRFEIIGTAQNGIFVIDYAHNGASLEAALNALREYSPKRLICLFGSVGGRTFNRRRELGDVAARLADLCILTSDNPDFESPEKIIDDIARSFDRDGSCPYVKIPDRRDAIRHAVRHSRRGDIILLAGKGHEDYQLICEKKIPFSERAIILEALDEMVPFYKV